MAAAKRAKKGERPEKQPRTSHKDRALQSKIEDSDESGERSFEDADDSAEIHDHKTSESYMLRRLKTVRVLTFAEKNTLALICQSKDATEMERQQAMAKLVRHCLRFISQIAFQYAYQFIEVSDNSAIEASDLIQEGVLAFMHGVRKFDVSKGYDLLTYVGWWVHNGVSRAIKNKRPLVRIPIHVLEEMVPMQREWAETIASEQRTLGPSELAERCGVSREEVERYQTYLQDHVSLDKKPFGERDVTLGDLFPDCGPLPERTAEQEEDRRYLLACLQRCVDETLISKEDAEFIRRRFGLKDSEGRTRQQMAEIYRMSEQKVQKTEKRILTALATVLDRSKVNLFMENRE